MKRISTILIVVVLIASIAPLFGAAEKRRRSLQKTLNSL